MRILQCGESLVDIRDTVHNQMFELQSTQQASDYESLLLEDTVESIVTSGKSALVELTECNKDSEHLPEIKTLVNSINAHLLTAEKKRKDGKKYLLMSRMVAQDLILDKVNKLANKIHLSAQELMESNETYGGCDVMGGLGSVHGGSLAYCKGALVHLEPNKGERKALLRNGGEKIDHQIGQVHHASLTLREAPDHTSDIEFEYIESGFKNWKHRQARLIEFLQSIGLECEQEGKTARCKGEVKNPDITRMAVILSQTPYIEITRDEDCLDKIMVFIEEQGAEILAEDEPWSAQLAQPSTWGWNHCQNGSENGEDEDEERKEYYKRLKYDAENRAAYTASEAEEKCNKAKIMPCALPAFKSMATAIDLEGDLSSACNEVTDRAGDFITCRDNLFDTRERNEEASKELLARCDTKPIIAITAAEQSGYGLRGALAYMKDVCEKADDQECLAEIGVALKRDEQGIKQAVMAFGLEG